MNTALALVVVVFLFSVLGALINYQVLRSAFPIARPALEATWKMTGSIEGFADKMTLSQWLPSPEVLTKPAVGDCPGTLEDAAPYAGGVKGAYNNDDLLDDWLKPTPPGTVARGPTAAKCYGTDYARGLELSSYAQRTNNYPHGNGESCSAPNHDLILNFYKLEGVPGPQ